MANLKTTSGQIVSAEEGSDLYKQYKAGGAGEVNMDGSPTSISVYDLGAKKYMPLPENGPKLRPIDTSVLNSDNLSSPPADDFSSYQESSIYDVSKLDFQPMQMTQPEQQAQGYSDTLGELNKMLAGESSFRSQQEEKQNIPELIRTQNDLTSRLNTLKNEQMAIPLLIQQESIGQGRTKGGVAPIETARLRDNAIQALSTSALLQATQGNITTANTLIDRAVKQQFDPIRERIDIATKNLELILKSPAYSLADKNRANQQLAIQEQKKTALEEEKERKKSILTIATEAAKYGAGSELLVQIQNAKTEGEALALASEYLGRDYADKQEDKLYTRKVEAEQRAFENSLATGEFNLNKAKYKTELEQIAFENGLSVKELQLKREMFENDADYKNSQLLLDQIKLGKESSELTVNEKISLQDKGYKLDENGNLVTNSTSSDKVQKANDVIAQIDSLMAGDAWKKAVGPIDSAMPSWASGEKNTIRANIETLITSVAIDNLSMLKGPMSDKDIEFIKNASSGLNTNMSEKGFKEKIDKIREKFSAIKYRAELQKEFPLATPDELEELYNEEKGFSQVGGDTNKAILEKVSKKEDGTKGGQCGAFVNKLTGLGVGDSYQSKMSKMDPTIKNPKPGMVFTMPYKQYGHIGIIVAIKGDKAVVKDSNYNLDEKVKTHEIPIKKMTGFARV